MKSCYILLLCVSVFLLLGMGMSIFYKNNVLVAIKPLTDLASNTRSTYNRMLVEVPGMVPDDVYKAARATQECAVIFGKWVWWLLTVLGSNVYHCFMVAFKIPMMYKRKTSLAIKTSRMWKNTVGIDPCTQVLFWMTMDNLIGIASVEEYVYQFLVTGIEVVFCFYVLYVPACLICNQFGMRTTHSKLWMFGHFLFWVWLINQHLQLWQALYDTYKRIQDPKSPADWLVLMLKAKHVKCADVLFGKVP